MVPADIQPDAISVEDEDATSPVSGLSMYRFSMASQTTVGTALPEYSVFAGEDAVDLERLVLSGHNRPRAACTLQYSGIAVDTLSGNHIVGPTHSILVGADLDHGASEQWPAHRVPYDFGVGSNSAEKSWMTLRVVGGTLQRTTRAEKSRVVPLWGGASIKGEVTFDINPKNQQTIQDISLVLRGRILNGSGSGQYFTFCEDKHPIWPAPDSTLTAKGTKFTGSHSFPFEFPFPTHIDLTNRRLVAPRPLSAEEGRNRTSRGLPTSPSTTSLLSRVFRRSSLMLSGSTPGSQGNPTRLDPDITGLQIDGKRQKAYWPLPHSATPSTGVVQIRYELVLHVNHGRMRPQTKIKVPIHMVPRLIPPQVLPNGDGLPTKNPTGWLELQPFDITGRLAGAGFGSAHITATYKLFVSKPLSYLRGTSIGLFLAVKVSSGGISSPFCSPSQLNVRLRQRLTYLCDRTSSVARYNDDAMVDKDFNRFDSSHSSAFPGTMGEWGMLGGTHPEVIGDDSGRGQFLQTIEDPATVLAQWEVIPLKDLESETSRSQLEGYQSFLAGRIDLPKDLEPSSACPIYSRQYFVEFDSPTIPSFTPFSQAPPPSGKHSTSNTPYVSQSVDIVSLPYFL